MKDKKKKIIIDCDPGIDDAIALYLAVISKNVEILGVTCVYGNVPLTITAHNALGIVESLGIDCPVSKGAEKPIVAKAFTGEYLHGNNGLAGLNLSVGQRDFSPLPAWDFIYETAKTAGEKITLVALGPLTNIAIALFKHEDLPDYISQIVMMGGTSKSGNAGALSEFNIYNDPHAAQAVLNREIPLVLVGLDSSDSCFLTSAEITDIISNAPVWKEELRTFFDVYLGFHEQRGYKGAVIHDAIAMLVAIDNEVAEMTPRHIEIELNSPLSLGRTIIDDRSYTLAPTNGYHVQNVDKSAYIRALKGI